MRQKTGRYMFVAAIALLIAGCGNNAKKQTKEKTDLDKVNVAIDGTKTLQLNSVKVTWIQDNAKEHLMPRTIFPDASDALIISMRNMNYYNHDRIKVKLKGMSLVQYQTHSMNI